MKLGIFARTFVRPTLDGVLAAVRQHGLTAVQFNLSCAGLETLPDALDPATCRRILAAFAACGLEMVGVSGTFNAIHPDLPMRRRGIARCQRLIATCPSLGTSLVTLCTGTRDPDNLWRAHPANADPESWSDLLGTLAQLIPVAEAHGVTLGIEPETGNVIDSARQARRLLDEIRSDRLKIILDAANLFTPDNRDRMAAVLEEAFELLAADLVMAHAKELDEPGSKRLLPAGAGRLDWDRYFGLLRAIGFQGPLVLHNLEEADVAAAVAFVRQHSLSRETS